VIDDPKYPTPSTPQSRTSPNATESKSFDTRERAADAPGSAGQGPAGSRKSAGDLSMQELMAIPHGAQAPPVNHELLNEAVPQIPDTHEDFDNAAGVLFHIATAPVGVIGNGVKWGWGILRAGRAGLAAARAGAARAAAKAGAASFTRPLQAADFGAKATVEVIEGTLSVQDKVATIGVKYIQGNLGNPVTALNALKETARQAGATTLRIEGTIANPRLEPVLTRILGPATRGAPGGPQDIWVLAL
jgi:hypothetical protein